MSARTIDWISIEGEYRANARPVKDIARRYQVSDTAILKRAKKYGWARDPQGTKREIVKAALAGGTPGQTATLEVITAEADADVQDMQRGIRIARLCLLSLEQSAQTERDPREIKTIVEASGAAIAAIRTIRGLNDPVESAKPLTWDDFYGDAKPDQ